MKSIFIFIPLCILIMNVEADVEKIFFNYSSTDSFVPLKHFWKSCGFCPPDPKINISTNLLSLDHKLNLALIGSMPNRSIRQVRIHWLLNMIAIKSVSKNQTTYNFTDLDKFIDWLHQFDLIPRFELMAEMTANTFVSKDYQYWYDLTKNIAERYSVKYKRQFPKWKFETWNEPDLHGYNKLNFSLQDYLQYVNASARGIKDALLSKTKKTHPPKFGGPAGLFKQQPKHPLCWGLLQFCNDEFTKCPLEYISFHKKGEGSTETLLNGTLELLDYIHKKYVNIRRIPIANDEADVQQNWAKSEEWRGDVRYAAMVAKTIINYQTLIVKQRNVTIELLSNDNCFLNYHPFYFTQRSLLTRFQMNNTVPAHVQFIKKPVYTVMGLLSLLGDEGVDVDISNPLITVYATRSLLWKTKTFLIVYVNDTIENNRTKRLDVVLKGVEGIYVIYLLNNIDTNPFLVWKTAGSPVFPPKALRTEMRRAQHYVRTSDPKQVIDSSLKFNLNLSLPSFVLVHVCCENPKAPGGVTKLRIYNITWNEVLLTWSDRRVKSKCVLTYEIEFLGECGGRIFERVNSDDTIFLSYHFAPEPSGDRSCESTRGRYRVRAVDYWRKRGKYSNTAKHPPSVESCGTPNI